MVTIRGVMRVNWTERTTNDWVLKETGTKNKDRLLVKVDQAQRRCFGPAVRGNSLIERIKTDQPTI